MISFWHDKWLGVGRLRFILPVLYSYARDSSCTVASQFDHGRRDIQLHPNLSTSAVQELHRLNSFLLDVLPTTAHPDLRRTAICNREFSTTYIYGLLNFRGMSCTFAHWIWDPIIPLKDRSFLWLAF